MTRSEPMTTATAIKDDRAPVLAPLSLKDAPSFIERQFPVGRLSAEAYKERKAGAGQTLTALGSYWKGRKPLILVRAVVLGTLLPATGRPTEDLDIFLKLMAMDDAGLARRIEVFEGFGYRSSPGQMSASTSAPNRGKPKWLRKLDDEVLARLVEEWFATFPYERRLSMFAKGLRNATRPNCSRILVPGKPPSRHRCDSIPELMRAIGHRAFRPSTKGR